MQLVNAGSILSPDGRLFDGARNLCTVKRDHYKVGATFSKIFFHLNFFADIT